ncbi:MAG: hypothetical protein R2769_10275 [Saprospiraceae bacterium]
MTRRILAALLFISFWTLLNAQQNIEWRSDTYAGINSIYLNPSFSSQYPLKWDLNLVGIGFYWITIMPTSVQQATWILSKEEII